MASQPLFYALALSQATGELSAGAYVELRQRVAERGVGPGDVVEGDGHASTVGPACDTARQGVLAGRSDVSSRAWWRAR